MVNFKLEQDAKLSQKEKKLLAEAKKRPIVFDDDSPELTADMEKKFMEARRKQPQRTRPITLYVSPATIEKAQHLGGDSAAVLGRILDEAVKEYVPT